MSGPASPNPGVRVTTLDVVAPWVWFTIAVVAAAVGVALLLVDRSQRTAHQRERRRWATLRGWRFVDADPVLPARWAHGVIAQGGAGAAVDLIEGRLFTAHGRRAVFVFDHEQGGKITSVVVAVQRTHHAHDLVVELWLPSVPFPQDAGLDLLGPVGDRYAFVTDLGRARPLITPDLVDCCAEIGEDIPVAWCEQDWVLASAPATAIPARLERLLRALGEVADQLDAGVEVAGEQPDPDEPDGYGERANHPEQTGHGEPHREVEPPPGPDTDQARGEAPAGGRAPDDRPGGPPVDPPAPRYSLDQRQGSTVRGGGERADPTQ